MGICIDEELLQRAQALSARLRRAGRSVVTAESCTAGLVAAVLSYGKNAAEYLHGGFVVYTKAQKTMTLGVDETLLRERGSVNGLVAAQMAEGALRRSQASMAVSVTGVLGPDCDEDNNPPGLVIVGLARSGQPTLTAQHEFGPLDPDAVRKGTVLRALDMLSSEVD